MSSNEEQKTISFGSRLPEGEFIAWENVKRPTQRKLFLFYRPDQRVEVPPFVSVLEGKDFEDTEPIDSICMDLRDEDGRSVLEDELTQFVSGSGNGPWSMAILNATEPLGDPETRKIVRYVYLTFFDTSLDSGAFRGEVKIDLWSILGDRKGKAEVDEIVRWFDVSKPLPSDESGDGQVGQQSQHVGRLLLRLDFFLTRAGLYWCPSEQKDRGHFSFLPLVGITEIYLGKYTGIFRHPACKKVDPDAAMSIVWSDKCLDLEATDPTVIPMWVTALKELLTTGGKDLLLEEPLGPLDLQAGTAGDDTDASHGRRISVMDRQGDSVTERSSTRGASVTQRDADETTDGDDSVLHTADDSGTDEDGSSGEDEEASGSDGSGSEEDGSDSEDEAGNGLEFMSDSDRKTHEDRVAFMEQGQIFNGYGKDPQNITRVVCKKLLVWYTRKRQRGYIYWCDAKDKDNRVQFPNCCIPVDQLQDLYIGKQTKVLRSEAAEDANPDYCLTMIGIGVAINLEARNKQQLTQWMFGIEAVLTEEGKQVHRDLRHDEEKSEDGRDRSDSRRYSVSDYSLPKGIPRTPQELMKAMQSGGLSAQDHRETLKWMRGGRPFTRWYANENEVVVGEKVRLFFSSRVEKPYGALYYCAVEERVEDERRMLPMREVTALYMGKDTTVFKAPEAEVAVGTRCFSLIRGRNSLNFEAQSEAELTAYLFGINRLMEKCGRMVIPEGDAVVASPEKTAEQKTEDASDGKSDDEDETASVVTTATTATTATDLGTESSLTEYFTALASASPAEVVEMMKEGSVFLSYGTRTKPELKEIFMFYDPTQGGRSGALFWCDRGRRSYDHSIPLSEIAEIFTGKHSSVFEVPEAEGVAYDRCLSIHALYAELHVEAEIPEQLTAWVNGLSYLLTTLGRNVVTKAIEGQEAGALGAQGGVGAAASVPGAAEEPTPLQFVTVDSWSDMPEELVRFRVSFADAKDPDRPFVNGQWIGKYQPDQVLSEVEEKSTASGEQGTALSAPKPAVLSLPPYETSRMLINGTVFQGYGLNRYGKIKKEALLVFYQGQTASAIDDSGQLPSLGKLYWCPADGQRRSSKSTSFDLGSLTGVYVGKHSRTFISPGAMTAAPDRCVTLVGERVVDLEARSVEQLTAWLFGLNGLLRSCGRRVLSRTDHQLGGDVRVFDIVSDVTAQAAITGAYSVPHTVLATAPKNILGAVAVNLKADEARWRQADQKTRVRIEQTVAKYREAATALRSLSFNETVRMMSNGQNMSMYWYGGGLRRSFKKDIFVFYAPRDSRGGTLYWCPRGTRVEAPDCRLPLHTVIGVFLNKQTPVFTQDVAAQVPPQCCFSLITKSQDYNFTCESAEQVSAWMFGLSCVLRGCGKRIIIDAAQVDKAMDAKQKALTSEILTGAQQEPAAIGEQPILGFTGHTRVALLEMVHGTVMRSFYDLEVPKQRTWFMFFDPNDGKLGSIYWNDISDDTELMEAAREYLKAARRDHDAQDATPVGSAVDLLRLKVSCNRLALTDITDIYTGKHTVMFEKTICDKANDAFCMTLIGRSDMLSVEAPDERTYRAWMFGISRVLTKAGSKQLLLEEVDTPMAALVDSKTAPGPASGATATTSPGGYGLVGEQKGFESEVDDASSVAGGSGTADETDVLMRTDPGEALSRLRAGQRVYRYVWGEPTGGVNLDGSAHRPVLRQVQYMWVSDDMARVNWNADAAGQKGRVSGSFLISDIADIYYSAVTPRFTQEDGVAYREAKRSHCFSVFVLPPSEELKPESERRGTLFDLECMSEEEALYFVRAITKLVPVEVVDDQTGSEWSETEASHDLSATATATTVTDAATLTGASTDIESQADVESVEHKNTDGKSTDETSKPRAVRQDLAPAALISMMEQGRTLRQYWSEEAEDESADESSASPPNQTATRRIYGSDKVNFFYDCRTRVKEAKNDYVSSEDLPMAARVDGFFFYCKEGERKRFREWHIGATDIIEVWVGAQAVEFQLGSEVESSDAGTGASSSGGPVSENCLSLVSGNPDQSVHVEFPSAEHLAAWIAGVRVILEENGRAVTAIPSEGAMPLHCRRYQVTVVQQQDDDGEEPSQDQQQTTTQQSAAATEGEGPDDGAEKPSDPSHVYAGPDSLATQPVQSQKGGDQQGPSAQPQDGNSAHGGSSGGETKQSQPVHSVQGPFGAWAAWTCTLCHFRNHGLSGNCTLCRATRNDSAAVAAAKLVGDGMSFRHHEIVEGPDGSRQLLSSDMLLFCEGDRLCWSMDGKRTYHEGNSELLSSVAELCLGKRSPVLLDPLMNHAEDAECFSLIAMSPSSDPGETPDLHSLMLNLMYTDEGSLTALREQPESKDEQGNTTTTTLSDSMGTSPVGQFLLGLCVHVSATTDSLLVFKPEFSTPVYRLTPKNALPRSEGSPALNDSDGYSTDNGGLSEPISPQVLQMMLNGSPFRMFFARPAGNVSDADNIEIFLVPKDGVPSDGALYWVGAGERHDPDPARCIPVRDITEVGLGKQNAVFSLSGVAQEAKDGQVFSLFWSNSSEVLNLEATSNTELLSWVYGLDQLVRRGGRDLVTEDETNLSSTGGGGGTTSAGETTE